jgi:UDP-N-acetylmuramoyl-L-alanyl-D-glutamate--2,6-diaminopimelate ligase
MIEKELRNKILRKYKNYKHLLTSFMEVISVGYPAKKMRVIGVTGTDGKTTTSHLIFEILKKAGFKVALISTIGAFVENKKVDTGFHVTTPDAKFLQPLLRKIANKGIDHLVIEVTSHGLDQYRTFGCNFWAGVLTNVTHEHLDYHKTFENYRKAKGRLFRGVKLAILNKDDPSFSYFKTLLRKNSRLVSYSLKAKSTLSASNIKFDRGSMGFLVRMGEEIFKVDSRLVGKYNVSNVLASIGLARSLDIGWDVILSAVKNFRGVEGRMQVVEGKQRFSVIVDFAHTPNALRSVLQTLRTVVGPRARLISVFGCAGERDESKRPMMGKIASVYGDVSVFTAEDPRYEDLKDIIKQIVAGAARAGAHELRVGKDDRLDEKAKKGFYVVIPDRKEAIDFAVNRLAKESDVVIICGKGHEKTMAFGSKEIPWSDVKAARQALRFGKNL